MKIFRRLSKSFKASVVLSVIFTLLFPFSLLAETQYKVPKNSLSYFMQNPSQSATLETVTDKETGAVLPPLEAVDNSSANTAPVAPAAATPATVSPEPVQQAPEIAKPAQAPVIDRSFTEAPSMETVVVEASEEKIASPQYEEKMNPPQITASSPESAAHDPIIAAAPSTGDEPAFSAVLARMQQNKAKRVAAAEKLGLVLPSQGGDIAAVSPSLSKIQQTVQNILARHA